MEQQALYDKLEGSISYTHVESLNSGRIAYLIKLDTGDADS